MKVSMAIAVGALALTTACSARQAADIGQPASSVPTGVVRGTLLTVGGPAPGNPNPVYGTVSLHGPVDTTVQVGANGVFDVQLPAGVYHLTGNSPQFGSDDGVCQALRPVTVRVRAGIHANVLCRLR